MIVYIHIVLLSFEMNYLFFFSFNIFIYFIFYPIGFFFGNLIKLLALCFHEIQNIRWGHIKLFFHKNPINRTKCARITIKCFRLDRALDLLSYTKKNIIYFIYILFTFYIYYIHATDTHTLCYSVYCQINK